MGLNVTRQTCTVADAAAVSLLIGLAASVAHCFAVVLCSQEPDYQTLYSNMENVRFRDQIVTF